MQANLVPTEVTQSQYTSFKKSDTQIESGFSQFYSQQTNSSNGRIDRLILGNITIIGEMKLNNKLAFANDGRIVEDESFAVSRSLYALADPNHDYTINNLAVFVVFLKNYYKNNRLSPEEAEKLELKIGKATEGLGQLVQTYTCESRKKEDNIRIVKVAQYQLNEIKTTVHATVEKLIATPLDNLLQAIQYMVQVYKTCPREQQINEIRKSVHTWGDLTRYVSSLSSGKESKLTYRFIKVLTESVLEDELKEVLFSEFLLYDDEIEQSSKREGDDAGCQEKLNKLNLLIEQFERTNIQTLVPLETKLKFLNDVLEQCELFTMALSLKDKNVPDLTDEEIKKLPDSNYFLSASSFFVGNSPQIVTTVLALCGVNPVLLFAAQTAGTTAIRSLASKKPGEK